MTSKSILLSKIGFLNLVSIQLPVNIPTSMLYWAPLVNSHTA